MGRTITLVLIVAVVGALIGWVYFLKTSDDGTDPAPALVSAPEPLTLPEPEPPPPEPEPAPVFAPVVNEPAGVEPEPLPALDDSDETVLGALRARTSAGALERLLVPEAVVRKIVVTVDNLPRENVSMKVRALRAAPRRFLVTGEEDTLELDPANYARYGNYVRLLSAFDPADAGEVYVNLYPLLQEAYVELGYPERQFHTRVLQVIDHLLATPEVTGPIRLTRPHVLYEFADPRLEALSAGQKMLLRSGADNAAVAREWLRALRENLSGRQID